MNKELWKPIEGFCDYQISNFGRVLSSRQNSPKVLKPKILGKGYYGVTLCGGSQKKRYLHHLVFEAFVGPRPIGEDGCHNDGNRANNSLDNLRWDTREGNFSDKVAHGTLIQGSDHTNSKLDETLVSKIRSKYKRNGVTQSTLAREFGVCQQTIWAIVNRKTWKHI